MQLGDQAICGSSLVTIQGYGEIEVALTNPKGQVKFLRLNNVSYCPEFPTNLVSLKLLEDRGIDWDYRKGQLRFHSESEVLDLLYSERGYCYNNSHIGKLGWPDLEFTVFITINIEGCLSQVTSVRPAIYPTYRIAMPSCIASALPP